LHGFNKAAVALSAVSGTAEKPMSITQVRIFSERDSLSGIDLDSQGLQHDLALLHNRFEGPLRGGVRVAAPVQNVQIRHNRFFRNNAAIVLARTPTALEIKADMVANTFFETHRGVQLDQLPSDKSTVEIRDNLFLRTMRVTNLDGLKYNADPGPASWVWHDENLPKGKESLILDQPRYFRRSFDLATKPTSASLEIGCDDRFEVQINGKALGKSHTKTFNQQIYRFDAIEHLSLGKNVITVVGTNELDPINPNFRTAAGLIVRLTCDDKVALVSDESWKSSAKSLAGWTDLAFDDSTWKPVRVWTGSALVWPWMETTWQSSIEQQTKTAFVPSWLKVSGNVRDYKSWEGWPLLDTRRGVVEASGFHFRVDPKDESFLRYPRSHALNEAGLNRGPVGVGQ
jgi:hypothetical protein